MALEVLHYGGYIDGDLPRKTSPTDYVAGMAAKITTTGVDVATTPATFLGLFKNDKSEDDRIAPQAADAVVSTQVGVGVVIGTNKVRMTPGVLAADVSTGTKTNPYVWPGSAGGGWNAGDLIYVQSSGKWDNQVQTGGDPAFGVVTRAPTASGDEMHVAMLR